MSKGSDINVGSIEEDIKNLEKYIELVIDKNYCECNELNVICYGKYADGSKNVASSIKNILKDYARQKQINEEHQKLNGELRQAINTVEKEKSDWIKAYQEEKDSQFELLKRIKELEEETTKLKAQHIFTRNKATDEEKAELYDVIDKTLGTFLEQEKPIWQQEMTTDKMNLEEALNIVNEMYQDRYKIIQENDTIYVDKLKDVKFTNLEFASVILLREVQSLQNKFKNSIPTQKVIDKTEYLKKQRRELGFKTYLKREDMLNDDRIIVCEIQVLQELLETK